MGHLLNTQRKSLQLEHAASARGAVKVHPQSLPLGAVVSLCLVVLLCQLLVRSAAAAEPSTLTADLSLPAITNIQQLRLLSREEARRGYPVKVTAVVTYFDLAWSTLFIQDDEAGCFVYVSDKKRRLSAGQRIEIDGRSDTGFVPVIRESRLTVL